ncbi:hypothetical protein XPN_1645, partial [Xanthomonas arboricola pv. pruni MAFF 301427]
MPCNRCRSRAWPAACCRPPRRPVDSNAAKARCWAAWEGCWMATTGF